MPRGKVYESLRQGSLNFKIVLRTPFHWTNNKLNIMKAISTVRTNLQGTANGLHDSVDKRSEYVSTYDSSRVEYPDRVYLDIIILTNSS